MNLVLKYAEVNGSVHLFYFMPGIPFGPIVQHCPFKLKFHTLSSYFIKFHHLFSISREVCLFGKICSKQSKL